MTNEVDTLKASQFFALISREFPVEQFYTETLFIKNINTVLSSIMESKESLPAKGDAPERRFKEATSFFEVMTATAKLNSTPEKPKETANLDLPKTLRRKGTFRPLSTIMDSMEAVPVAITNNEIQDKNSFGDHASSNQQESNSKETTLAHKTAGDCKNTDALPLLQQAPSGSNANYVLQ